jgi:serine/threonine protein kinase
LLDALGEAHRCSLIHRDIKPSNILLHEQDGLMIPKIADFGIAKALDEGENELTRTGASLGTIKYMAPEQFLDSKTVDQRADIYSFGVLLFLLLTGRMPFRGDSQVALYQQMNEGAPSLHSINEEISPALEEVVLTCLAPQREDRYPSCDALLRALALVVLGEMGESLEECRELSTTAMRERILKHFTQAGEKASQSTLQGFAAGTVLHEAFLQRPKVPIADAELGTSSSQGYRSPSTASRKLVPLEILPSSPLPTGNPTPPHYTEQKETKEQGGILRIPLFDEPTKNPSIRDSSSRISSTQAPSNPSFSLNAGGAVAEKGAALRKAPSSALRSLKQEPKESSLGFLLIFGGLTALVLLGGAVLLYPLLKTPAPPPPVLAEPPLRVVEQGEGYWDEQLRPVWKTIDASEKMSMVWEKQRIWIRGKRPLPPPPPEKNKTKKHRRIQPKPKTRIHKQIAKPQETKKTKKR